MTQHRLLNASWLSAFVLLCACGGSTGFYQPAPRDPATLAAPTINEDQVRAAFELRPQLPRPYRLGVFFRTPADDSIDAPWRWDAAHKRAVLGFSKAVHKSGEVSDVFAIDDATSAADDLRAIRIAAARHGADAVLVVSGKDEVRRSSNAWAASYVALLPMLFAPGSELDVTFFAHAEMWDVRNEYLYLSAEAEGEVNQQRALCWLDRRGATQKAQKESVSLLVSELEGRFAGLHAGAPR
jgi:hypothetical protein